MIVRVAVVIAIYTTVNTDDIYSINARYTHRVLQSNNKYIDLSTRSVVVWGMAGSICLLLQDSVTLMPLSDEHSRHILPTLAAVAGGGGRVFTAVCLCLDIKKRHN